MIATRTFEEVATTTSVAAIIIRKAHVSGSGLVPISPNPATEALLTPSGNGAGCFTVLD
jgi:hypothetical protein